MFVYVAYTITIMSELELPELFLSTQESNHRAVVNIRVGNQLPDNVPEDACIIEPHRFYLNLLGIASYEVSGGSKIEVKLAKGANLSEVRLYLLGTCFGMLLHQRNILAFHASSVATPRGAVFFTGPSGIGKSTLLCTLTQLGYTMLSDDVVGVRLSDINSPMALPSFPRSKLRSDSAIQLGLEPSPEDATITNLDKTQLDLRRHFSQVSVPVRRIYSLHVGDDPNVRIISRSPFDALTTIVENTYRAEFLGHPSLRTSHFDLVTRLAKQIEVFDVFRPRNPFQPLEFAQTLKRHFLD